MDKNIKAKTFGTLHKDLFFDKKVSISFDTIQRSDDYDLNVLVQIEPPSILNISQKIIDHQENFDLILTWDNNLHKSCLNSVLFPFGSCWIDESDQEIHKKTKEVSIIASSKNQTFGHKLRHSLIFANILKLDLFGNGYNPIDNKISGLRDYRFSVIIENEKIDNWFTEKIIDCLVTGTVPIYWGCPNISEYFDIRGFIIINSFEDFSLKKDLFNEDTYTEMLPFIKINFDLAKKYTNFWFRIEEEINKKIHK